MKRPASTEGDGGASRARAYTPARMGAPERRTFTRTTAQPHIRPSRSVLAGGLVP